MSVRVKFWLYRHYPTKNKTFCDIIISRVVLLIDVMIIMDLLERINNCSDDELTSIIDAALQSAINNSDRKRGIYSWYKALNNFLEKVENIKK